MRRHGPGAASHGERDIRHRWLDAGKRAASRDGSAEATSDACGGSSGRCAPRQAQRADVDRAHPGCPEQGRSDGDLGRAAADVDDRDHLRQRARSARAIAPSNARRPSSSAVRIAHGEAGRRGERPHERGGRRLRGAPAPSRSRSPASAPSAAARAREAGAHTRCLVELVAPEAAGALDLGAEPQIARAPPPRAVTAPSDPTAATSSRAVLEPTSITATRIGGRLSSTASAGARSPELLPRAAVRLTSGARLRAAHHRSLVVDRLLRASRGSSRVHVPSCPSVQACDVVARRRCRSTRAQLLACARVLDRDEHLDPAVEVARHHVGAADEDATPGAPPRTSRCGCARGSGRGSSGRGRSRRAPRRRAGACRSRGRRSPPRARGRRRVQLVDHGRVDEVVQLEADPGRSRPPRPPRPRADLLDQPRPHPEGCDEQLAEALRPAEARSRS